MNFRTRLECLYNMAEKACKGQTLYLITKIVNYGQKSFIIMGPGHNDIKLFLSVNYDFRNKLVYLSLASLSRLV
jgi:hypothetical protein